ncbi:MAG: DUF1573 domain-containing protein [Bacteroidales bacterium]|nr:DUF1573 domain-containing protein [Bacteroidales bacterium]
MKRVLIVFGIVIFAFSFAISQENTQNEKKAHIEFKEIEYDFGTIEYKAEAKHDFEFKNTGKETLVISNVRASCGCTTPSYSKEPIKKGDTGSISVKYDTKRIGPFTKSITVTSNADNPTIVLRIKGNVLNPPQQGAAQPQ